MVYSVSANIYGHASGHASASQSSPAMLPPSSLAVFTLFGALAASLDISERSLTPVIDVGYAKLQGITAANGAYQWLGVRYAQPPLGRLRFEAPQKVLGDGSLVVKNQV